MRIMLLPLLGPLHFRYPAYNAVTLTDLLDWFDPTLTLLTALTKDALHDPAWQDTPELALPLAVVPWLRRTGRKHDCIGEAPDDPAAPADFRRYAAQYPSLQSGFRDADAARDVLIELLGRPLTPKTVQDSLVPAAGVEQAALMEAFGDGPATGWLDERTDRLFDRIVQAGHGTARLAVLCELEFAPGLTRRLGELEGVTLESLPDALPASEAARARSLLDHAFLGDYEAPEALLTGLERLGTPEAGFARANVLLATGHAELALNVLEQVANGDFSDPYYLPGFVLARLGQLRDLVGKRELAKKAYRAVRALAWAPEEALAAARDGLEKPFTGSEVT